MSWIMIAIYLLALILAITGGLLVGYSLTGWEWFKSVFRGWDHFWAAILGGDGRHSISAYCGSMGTVFHLLGRRLIDGLFGELHCWNAAKREGLLL